MEDATPAQKTEGIKVPEDSPKWFTPTRMLAIFCAINMLNYIDRGSIASNGVNGRAADTDCLPDHECSTGSGIQGDFGLSNFEDGLLPAAFMVGLLFASPIFALGSQHYSPFRLIGVGLGVWTLALIGCGFSTGLQSLLVCRMFVGVGEASFISLAAPFIDDYAPHGRTTRWLALFYMCIPSGYAIGYIFGGLVPVLFGSWRAAFWVEAVLMMPFVALALVSKPLPLRGMKKSADEETLVGSHELKSTARERSLESIVKSMMADLLSLATNKTYLVNVAGYTAYTFVIGAYAFWGPKAAKLLFHMDNADSLFGAVTVVSGIGGTIFGGVVLDYMGGSVSNAFMLMGAVTFIGGIFCLAAFLAPNTASFIALLMLGEFFVFAIQGPANIVSMKAVGPKLRSLSIAGSTVLTHLLGDVPSPPILGALQDAVNDWRISMGVFTAILVPSALLWASGAFIESPSLPCTIVEVPSEGLETNTEDATNNQARLLRHGTASSSSS